MNKRIKHITLNLTDEQYKSIEYIAEQQKRKIADAAYLILIDNIDKVLLSLVDLSPNAKFKPLKYRIDDDD